MTKMPFLPGSSITLLVTLAIIYYLYRRLFNPLYRIPGPYIPPWPLNYFISTPETSTRSIHNLHIQYGPVVRVSSSQISFNTPSAVKTIYGVGSRAQRTPFYRIFEPYGRPTMFTMASGAAHSDRKRYLARAYARKGIVTGEIAGVVERKVASLLRLFGQREGETTEICALLYAFTLDLTTAFIFGEKYNTAALEGDERDWGFVEYLGQARKRKTGSSSAFLKKTVEEVKQLFSTRASSSQYFRPSNPVTAWALETFNRYRDEQLAGKNEQHDGNPSLVSELWTQREQRLEQQTVHDTSNSNIPEDIDLASECADHMMAGIETTRSTLIFLIWALSRPCSAHIQQKLRHELQSNLPSTAIPSVASTTDPSALPYLHAVVRETLRLYNPLPQPQPRVFETDVVVDRYTVPAGMTVSVAPYTLHRDDVVFEEPGAFRPERWLDAEREREMKRWFWPFSSGGRMCTGLHLATATLHSLTAALYMQYSTSVHEDFAGVSPAVNSVLETFWDESFDKHEENRCLIRFAKLERGKEIGEEE